MAWLSLVPGPSPFTHTPCLIPPSHTRHASFPLHTHAMPHSPFTCTHGVCVKGEGLGTRLGMVCTDPCKKTPYIFNRDGIAVSAKKIIHFYGIFDMNTISLLNIFKSMNTDDCTLDSLTVYPCMHSQVQCAMYKASLTFFFCPLLVLSLLPPTPLISAVQGSYVV